jgi:large subunit ribosomal protein L4
MATLPIYNAAGSQVGSYEIDPAAIAPKINKQLLHDVVVMYQRNLRQGTSNTKSRGEVAGSTRKLYRQKGTGNARVGSRRTPHRRGGGHAKTIETRDYSFRMPKKAIRAATKMAIASKLLDNQVVVIDQLSMTEPKTKQMAAILKALNLGGQSTLVAVADHDTNVYKSTRNIDRVSITQVSGLNALSVLRPRRLLITTAALDRIKDGTFAQGRSAQDHATQGTAE